MIARLLAFVAIIYVLGFAFFAVTLGGPAPDDTPKVDAIVAITGGKGSSMPRGCSPKERAKGC